MDPVSQAAIGAAAAQSGGRAKTLRHALWIGALAGMAPDLDVFIRSSDDPLLALEFHRQFTHSVFFIPVGAQGDNNNRDNNNKLLFVLLLWLSRPWPKQKH